MPTFCSLGTIRFTGRKQQSDNQKKLADYFPKGDYSLQIIFNFLWDINTSEIFLSERKFWGKEGSDIKKVIF